MIYECYTRDNYPVLLIDKSQRKAHDKNIKIYLSIFLIKTYEVEHYIEAHILMNEDFGLPPYRPHDSEIEEYMRCLRRLGKEPNEINNERESLGMERLPYLE